ncbi:hypothetical protein B0H14DRAFT_3474090 [Mycena olivaceomarginata]|nr:hypothetical protein B0H14DRAFT_3474090 [Mycena olivaceomarginata]
MAYCESTWAEAKLTGVTPEEWNQSHQFLVQAPPSLIKILQAIVMEPMRDIFLLVKIHVQELEQQTLLALYRECGWPDEWRRAEFVAKWDAQKEKITDKWRRMRAAASTVGTFLLPEQLGPLLNAFDSCPRLSQIVVAFHGISRAFKLALQRLSLYTAPIQPSLVSTKTGGSDNCEALHKFDGQIASCLYCVESVRLSTHSEKDMRAMLPWLACLPALRCLQLLYENDTLENKRGAALESVINDFRVALHWVPTVTSVRYFLLRRLKNATSTGSL